MCFQQTGEALANSQIFPSVKDLCNSPQSTVSFFRALAAYQALTHNKLYTKKTEVRGECYFVHEKVHFSPVYHNIYSSYFCCMNRI